MIVVLNLSNVSTSCYGLQVRGLSPCLNHLSLASNVSHLHLSWHVNILDIHHSTLLTHTLTSERYLKKQKKRKKKGTNKTAQGIFLCGMGIAPSNDHVTNLGPINKSMKCARPPHPINGTLSHATFRGFTCLNPISRGGKMKSSVVMYQREYEHVLLPQSCVEGGGEKRLWWRIHRCTSTSQDMFVNHFGNSSPCKASNIFPTVFAQHVLVVDGHQLSRLEKPIVATLNYGDHSKLVARENQGQSHTLYHQWLEKFLQCSWRQ